MPIVLTQPADTSVVEGNAATFTATASGTEPLLFQWQRNGTDLAGATGSALTIAVAKQTDHNATYAVRVSNATGSTMSRAATLTVRPFMGDMLTRLAGQVFTTGPAVEPVDGNSVDARLTYVADIAADRLGNVYVAEAGPYATEANAIRKISASGAVVTLAGVLSGPGSYGYVDGPSSTARFSWAQGIAVRDDGTLFIADVKNYAVRKMSAEGVVSTLTGGPGQQGRADGPLSTAQFVGPIGLALDAAGNAYVLDAERGRCLDDQLLGGVPYFQNLVVRKISAVGQVTTLPGTAITPSAGKIFLQSGIALDAAGNIYMSITETTQPGFIFAVGCGSFRVPSSAAYIRKITPAGEASVAAGSTTQAGAVDGTAAAARFQWPVRMAFDRFGALFIADGDNRAIRRLDPSGIVTTPIGRLPPAGTSELMLGSLPAQLDYTDALTLRADGTVVLVTGSGFRGRAVLQTARR